MVTSGLAAWALVAPLAILAADTPAPFESESEAEANTEADAAVRAALASGGYPWYDAEADAFEAVRTPRPRPRPEDASRSGSSGSGRADVGQLITFVLFSGGLLALIVLIARSWQRRLESEAMPSARPGPMREAARVGSLPTGLSVDESDPLAAAREWLARGDRRRAVVLLFAHQLLTLDRLGLVRLAPGRTGRQIVRSLTDAMLRPHVEPTLRLFEEVYYGHRDPPAEAVEAVWAEAEAFERAVARRGREGAVTP